MTSLYLLYIDPGIGSLAVQAIIAGFAAFTLFFKNYFKKIFWGKKVEQEEEEKEKENQNTF